MTLAVNTHRNHRAGLTGRIGLISMLALVLMTKLAAVLLTGATAVPGEPGRRATQPTIVSSRSGQPAGTPHYSLTPLGTMWWRLMERLRNEATTPSHDDPKTEGQAASTVSTYPEAHPPG